MSDGGKPTFDRYGHTYHLRIEQASDLQQAVALDEAHWVATSAPNSQFRCDPVLLTYLDVDADTRIKVGEMKACMMWLLAVLKDPSGIDSKTDVLLPDSINEQHADGKRILEYLQKNQVEGLKSVNLGMIRKQLKKLKDSGASEAGILFPESFQDEHQQTLMSVMIQKTGGVLHPGGKTGADLKTLELFIESIGTYQNWKNHQDDLQNLLHPYDSNTHAVHLAVKALETRLEKFFANCRLIAHDPKLKEKIWPIPESLETQIGQAVDPKALLTASLPAEPNPECVIKMDGAINPHDQEALSTLAKSLGEDSETISEQEWKTVLNTLKPYREWLEKAPSILFEDVDEDEFTHWTEETTLSPIRQAMIEADESALVVGDVKLAEKLSLFQKYMLDIANNMTSLTWLYNTTLHALFEEGTLVMDGRRFNLAVRVTDRNEHLKSTKDGSMFTLYVKLEHVGRNLQYEVAVPVTAGTQGNLSVGKRGVFTDLDGEEWAARVEHIEDHPVSLKEAILAPFQRLGGALTRKIEAISSDAEKNMEKASVGGLGNLTTPPAGGNAAGMGGALAGGGIAIAALGSSLAFMTKTLHDLTWVQVLSGLGGLVIAVLLPTIIVAWLKLRKRDLSSLLEGSGWAINARMRLTVAQRRYFTERPAYPLDSALFNPSQRTKWLVLILLIVALALVIGLQGCPAFSCGVK